MKQLIVTADDFGAATAVNEAVEQAHSQGVLTAASLMVTGNAAADAVERARRLPSLGVGLHLVLVEGRPVSPPELVPDLVDRRGLFRTGMARMGADIFFRPGVRRQVALEIEAQFRAFSATGLPLDHVNAHKHFHLHPTIAAMILRIGKRFGLKAARVPAEPRAVLTGIEPGAPSIVEWIVAPWAAALRGRFRRAGVRAPDQVFGLRWSGAMTAGRLGGLIANLPPGLSEIYLHPATDDGFDGHAPGYRYRDELAALVDPAVESAVREHGVMLGSFAAFIAGRTEGREG